MSSGDLKINELLRCGERRGLVVAAMGSLDLRAIGRCGDERRESPEEFAWIETDFVVDVDMRRVVGSFFGRVPPLVGEPCIGLGGHDKIACFWTVKIRFLLRLNNIDAVQLREELFDGVQIVFVLNIDMRDLVVAHGERAAVVKIRVCEAAGNRSR